MTTYVPFAPSPQGPFTFTAALDGTTYTVIVTWNVAGQRWYVTVATLQGVPIVCIAMIESPAGYDMPILAGYFTTTLIYREPTGMFEVGD